MITFDSPPEISRSHYIVKGPSGWVETLKRKDVDAELAKFIAPLKVQDAVDAFLLAREVDETRDVMGWYTIVGFLGRTMGCSPTGVPHLAGVAFWAQVILARAARKAN